MTRDAAERDADNQILRFFQYTIETAAKVSSPQPEELVRLQKQLDRILSEDKASSINNPLSFYRATSIISQKGNPTMGEIGQALAVPLSSATRMADFLVSNGYAQRNPDPHDRRVVRLTLTETGQKTNEIIERFLLQTYKRLLDCLTAEEKAILLTLFEKVVLNL